MAKPEWGMKRTCTHCGARFYDLNKSPIICPKCSAENEAEVPLKIRRTKDHKVAKPVKAVVPEEVDEDTLDVDVDDDGEDVMEDTTDLGEDDEDMSEVMEHVESEEDDT